MVSVSSAIPCGSYRESIPIPLERSFCLMETRHQCGQKRDGLRSVGDPVRFVQGIHPDSAGAQFLFDGNSSSMWTKAGWPPIRRRSRSVRTGNPSRFRGSGIQVFLFVLLHKQAYFEKLIKKPVPIKSAPGWISK